jgi:hypothetical protein
MFTESMVKQAFGAQKVTKEQTPAVSLKTTKQSSEQAQKPAPKTVLPTGKQPTEAIQKSARQAWLGSKVATQKPTYLLKAHKKIVPKAVVQPRTDLTYYGVLEDPQRYDPRPNSRMAGVPNPQTPDLTHDHFQELDRNQDGMIDPVERAFGRLDMEHDLYNRQLR